MGLVLHVRLTGEGTLPAKGPGAIERLLQFPEAPPPEEWRPDHPLLPLLEAAASLTPRVEPFSEEEFFADLDPNGASRLASFAGHLREGQAALAVLAPSRAVARAAGARLLLQPPPPGRGVTWEPHGPGLYRILNPARFLAPLPLAYLWTLPPEVRNLQRLGVWQIGQLSGVFPAENGPAATASPPQKARWKAPAPIPPSLLVEHLGAARARRLVEASRGVDPTPVRAAFPRPRVQMERPLPESFDGSGLQELLRTMADGLALELEHQGLGAGRLTLRCLLPRERSRFGAPGAPQGPRTPHASRRLPEPTGDPLRLQREGLRLAQELLAGTPPPVGTRLVLEADLLAPLQVHQAARLVAAGGAPETPPALAELLEQAHRRFGQAAPVPASRLPVSRRERMLRLWHGPR